MLSERNYLKATANRQTPEEDQRGQRSKRKDNDNKDADVNPTVNNVRKLAVLWGFQTANSCNSSTAIKLQCAFANHLLSNLFPFIG